MSTPKTIKIHCNKCGESHHDLLFEKESHGSEEIDEGFSIEWGVTWQVLQCRGCDAVSMRRAAWNSEALDERGRPEDEITYFPPRTFRKIPEWQLETDFMLHCPSEVSDLLKELYVCLQNDCPAASAMVVRAVFERMMIHAVGDNGTFKDNLNHFQASDFITGRQREVIEPVLEAGHASIHRAYVPTREDIVTLVEILEGILEVVYVHTPKAAALKKKIPKRKK